MTSLEVKTNNNFNFFPSKLHRLILELNNSNYAVNLCFGGILPVPFSFSFSVDESRDLCDFIGSGRLQAICKIVVINQNLPQIRGEHLKKILNTKPPIETICLAWLKNIPIPQATGKSHRSSPRRTNTPESGPGWFCGAPMGFTEPGFTSSRKSFHQSIDSR